MHMLTRPSSALALLGAVVLTAVGCAPDSDINGKGGGSSGGGTSQGGGADGGSTGNGFNAGGSGGSTGANMNECASESIEAELAPLMMFITFDKSGSMANNNKWTNASAALNAFFADPGAADLEVALRFFPNDTCDGLSCDIAACATPQVPPAALTVDAAPVDAQELALTNAVNNTSPSGGTPISAALDGAIQFCSQFLTTHPDHKVVAILVTDGEPNGCTEDIPSISGIAANGLVEGVPTYTIGLAGSNEMDLATIAMAGGGSSFVVGNGNTTADLVAALQAIRGEQLACELAVPMPTNGDPFDPNLVNVTYTPGGGGTPQTIGKVADASACGPSGGWYYNDNANPTQIELCPAICDIVRADPDGAIKVVLGCQSIPG